MIAGKLKAFSQLGYIEQDSKHSSQSRGRCPFCQRDGHFYINKKTLAWDCKRCGKFGSFNSFLKQITDFACINFKGKYAIALHKRRKIKIATFRKHRIGYLPERKIYIIPVYNAEGTGIINIRHCKLGKPLMTLSGCPTCLYRWETLTERKGIVWLCEGHWDAIALSEILDNKNDTYMAVPSANTFKTNWVNMLRDRKVNVLYDNDEAGTNGALKVFNFIRSQAKQLRFVHWPESCKKGYDVNDFTSEGKKLDELKTLLKENPKNVEVVEVIDNTDDIFDGEPVDVEEVYKVYQENLYLPNTNVIDVLFGTIIGNLHLDGDPIWMFLVAPPGGTKTELILSLSEAPKIFSISSLTPHALISGYGRPDGIDPSLIPKLNGKVIAIKDFTNILNLNQVAQQEIMGILRDAYDGECSKPFGNNQYKFYKSKFGIISGVTPVIEQHIETQSALGARFLYYNIPIDMSIKGTKKYLRKAMSNVNLEGKIKETLKETANKVLSYKYKDISDIPNSLQNKILSLSQFVAVVRGTVTRDRYSKEVTHTPFSELGTRLIKQLSKLLMSIAMFKHKSIATEDEFSVIKAVALSSIPSGSGLVLKAINNIDNTKEFTTGEISTMINLPRITTSRILENLYMLKVLKRIQPMVGKYKWRLTDDILEVIEESEVYK